MYEVLVQAIGWIPLVFSHVGFLIPHGLLAFNHVMLYKVDGFQERVVLKCTQDFIFIQVC